ncbi:MAG: transcription termination/antitermination NusG family protein, partial [Undibacterium sp.]
MAKQSQHHGRAWYVLHTYSGYEDNVARNLKQRIESMDMQSLIFDVLVPKEKKIKIKAGKRVVIEERIYPGYVLVDMVVTDASWYVVRNTPNVTGFIGLGTTPTPIDPAEIEGSRARAPGSSTAGGTAPAAPPRSSRPSRCPAPPPRSGTPTAVPVRRAATGWT